MKGQPYDRLGEMEIFIQAADSSNFSHTAERLGLSPSSISKLISRLESRLGVRLMNRTTRKMTLTEEGELYYHRAIRILADVDETEGLICSNQNNPQGKVRITCSAPFAYHQIIPLLPELTNVNPNIEITLLSTDQVTDLLKERCDIAIRIGHLQDSSLKARKLAETKRLLVASKNYLEQYGIPKHPNKLKDHICLNFHAHSVLNEWRFQKSGAQVRLDAKGPFNADNGESLRIMALSGGGIARLSAFIVRKDIKECKLVVLLQDWNPGEFHPIYLLHTGHVSARVKFVIDYIFEKLGGMRFE
jgi:DNA-binding transcriptional LysR family regulator